MEVADPLAGSLLALHDSLLLLGSQLALLLDDGQAAGSVFLVDLSGLTSEELSVGVQVVHGLVVAQGVALLDVMSGGITLLGTDGGLNLVAVDHTADVGVGDFSTGEHVALLLDSAEPAGTEDVVEFLEGISSPNDEATNVSSGSELEEVESADVQGLNTWDVSDGAEKWDVVTLVDDEGTTAAAVAAVSELTETSADANGVDDLPDIGIGSDVLQELNSLLGAFNSLDLVVDDERKFGDLTDSVTARLHQWQHSRSSEC